MNEATVRVPELVPIFPLPEVVLFPRQVLPLHIFEPRYCAMIEDVLGGDGAIGIALLKPDYEPLYFTSRAPIHTPIGVGRVIASEKLEDGKRNILVRGEARASIVREVGGRPYRLAQIRPVTTSCGESLELRQRLRSELCSAISRHIHREDTACQHFLQLFELGLPLDHLVDLISGCLPVVGEVRQCLLAELDLCARAQRLIEHIHALNATARRQHAIGAGAQAPLN